MSISTAGAESAPQPPVRTREVEQLAEKRMLAFAETTPQAQTRTMASPMVTRTNPLSWYWDLS